jgi:hypothetical protein
MSQLAEVIRRPLLVQAPEPIMALVEDMKERFGDALSGVLFYGSCLRQGDALDGVIDLYVLVSKYADAYPAWRSRMLARVLPPTVGYLEMSYQDTVLRTKYAVLSLEDFRRGTSRRWFHSYLWGRFAQPCVLAYSRDENTTAMVEACLQQAAETLLDRTMLAGPSRVDASALWRRALELSYSAEMRPESSGRAAAIVAADEEADDDSYRILSTRWRVMRTRVAWSCRRVWGKALSVARWVKALTTFEGGLDYAAWKLERHSGVKVQISDRMRRRPWLYVWGELIRLYRSGALR